MRRYAPLIAEKKASICTVTTTPPGATVSLDGKRLGESPLVFVMLRKDQARQLTLSCRAITTSNTSFSLTGTQFLSPSVLPQRMTMPPASKPIWDAFFPGSPFPSPQSGSVPMLKFTFKDKVTITVRASCPKHRRYNPEANGHGELLEVAPLVNSCLKVWTAKNRVESAIRNLRVLAESLNAPGTLLLPRNRQPAPRKPRDFQRV